MGTEAAVTNYERGFEDGTFRAMETFDTVTFPPFVDWIMILIPLYLFLYLMYKWGTKHDNRG